MVEMGVPMEWLGSQILTLPLGVVILVFLIVNHTRITDLRRDFRTLFKDFYGHLKNHGDKGV